MKWFAKNYYIEKSWLGNIECNERNHAAFADVKRTGKEEYSGRDFNNELSEFQ